MKISFSVIAGITALIIESLVFLSLFELPPFGTGGSDIIWGLPFFGLITFGLSVSGLISALHHKRRGSTSRGVILTGLVVNALAVAAPIGALLFGILRALLLK